MDNLENNGGSPGGMQGDNIQFYPDQGMDIVTGDQMEALANEMDGMMLNENMDH